MNVIYYKDPKLNFGDDLNKELWPRILSRELLEADDVAIVGIGSILIEDMLAHLAGTRKHVIVLGSGTSYGVPPKATSNWSILAVRGPLTAALIGRPEAAITDGAILLALAKDLIGPARPRTDVIFMPHHRSVKASPWNEIARDAGLTYVSPQQPVRDILAAFAKAKLVVTEAMHGAIVADTLRIPWIPVTIAPTVEEFKWRDWCLSMEVPFKPLAVAPGHASDHLRYQRSAAVLKKAGLVNHSELEQDTSLEKLEAYFAKRFSSKIKKDLLDTAPAGRLDDFRLSIASFANSRHRAKSVASLRIAAASKPYLSADTVFSRRLGEMQHAVALAERIVT